MLKIRHFSMVADRKQRIESVTFIITSRYSGTSMSSITSTLGELIDEINHYQAFRLTNTGEYTNEKGTVLIKPNKSQITEEMRYQISLKMRG